MSVSLKFSVFILFLLVFLVQTPESRGKNLDDLLKSKDDYPDANDRNFTYLISGGYRPAGRVLTKYLVSIRTQSYSHVFGDNHFCGGTIIGKRTILTAAHCLEGLNPWNLRVVVGSPRRFVRYKSTKVYKVNKIVIYDEWGHAGSRGDIALLVLVEDIYMDNKTVQMIPLAKKRPADGTKCTVVGWGRTFNNGPLTDEAVYVDVKIWPNELCRERLPAFDEGMLCASDPMNFEKDACSGDSGGPLFCNGEVAGVVSFGYGCGTPFLAGVYTDVFHYRNWLLTSRSQRLLSVSINLLFTLLAISQFLVN